MVWEEEEEASLALHQQQQQQWQSLFTETNIIQYEDHNGSVICDFIGPSSEICSPIFIPINVDEALNEYVI